MKAVANTRWGAVLKPRLTLMHVTCGALVPLSVSIMGWMEWPAVVERSPIVGLMLLSAAVVCGIALGVYVSIAPARAASAWLRSAIDDRCESPAGARRVYRLVVTVGMLLLVATLTVWHHATHAPVQLDIERLGKCGALVARA